MSHSPGNIPRITTTVASVTEVQDCVHDNSTDAEITIRARRLVFENTVFSVYADHVADNNENEVPEYLSVVPKCLLADSVAGVAVLPVRDGRIGLIRVFRHPLAKWSWEAIKGHVESGEDARGAAGRELIEESGFSVEADKFIDLGAVAPEAGVIKGRIHLFAVDLDGCIEDSAEGELGHGEMAFHDLEDIRSLMDEGEIEDATTLCVLFKHCQIVAKPDTTLGLANIDRFGVTIEKP